MNSKTFFALKVTDPYEDYHCIPNNMISNRDVSFVSAAAKVASTSENRFKVGALIVKSGRVMGGSPNITRCSPRTPPNRFSTHAEIAAINVASDTDGSTMYIARLNSRNFYSMSRPCAWCMEKIIEAGVSRVVHTTDLFFGFQEQVAISSFYVDHVTWPKSLSIS